MVFASFAGHVWKWMMRLFIYLFTYFFFCFYRFSQKISWCCQPYKESSLLHLIKYHAKKNVIVQSLCRFSHKGIFFKTEDSRRWRGVRRAMVTVWVKKRGQLVNLNSTGHRGNVHDPAKRSQPHRLVNHSHTHARAHTHTSTTQGSKFMG